MDRQRMNTPIGPEASIAQRSIDLGAAAGAPGSAPAAGAAAAAGAGAAALPASWARRPLSGTNARIASHASVTVAQTRPLPHHDRPELGIGETSSTHRPP